MSSLSLLEKNAYLSLYINTDFIYCHLAYSDYDNEEAYILHDVSRLPLNFSTIDLLEFWFNYFTSIEKKFNWKLIDRKSLPVKTFSSHIRPFVEGNDGVRGCTVKLSKESPFYKGLMTSLRDFCLDFKISVLDKSAELSLCKDISSKLEYRDCIFLDLNPRSFSCYRVINGGEKVVDGIYKWRDLKNLVSLVNSEKYYAFLTRYLSENLMQNIWGNFLLKPLLNTDSERFRDFIRAYIVLQLSKISVSEPRISKDFGLRRSKNLVYLTGDLIDIPSFRDILVSIIDGLNLNGSFDFCLDNQNVLKTFGSNFAKGSESDEMILTKDIFLSPLSKIYIPEMEFKKGTKSLVFNGKLSNSSKDMVFDIKIMSGEFTGIRVNDPSLYSLDGSLTDKAFIEHYEDKEIFLKCFNNGSVYNRIFFDCRFRPILHGPGPKENNLKFNEWFRDELSI